jgi:hypothetical protein
MFPTGKPSTKITSPKILSPDDDEERTVISKYGGVTSCTADSYVYEGKWFWRL